MCAEQDANTQELRLKRGFRGAFEWFVARFGSPTTRLEWEVRALLVQHCGVIILDLLCVGRQGGSGVHGRGGGRGPSE